MTPSPDNDLLTSTQDRAQRLREALRRQEAELVADRLLSPAVREAGLKAVRCAAQCAGRLVGLAAKTSNEQGPRNE